MIHGMIDIRNQLPRNPQGGPNQRNANKNGVVIHYSGPAVDWSRDPVAVIKSEAQYHVTKDWDEVAGPPYVNGDGYMYHITVDWRGSIYQTRDLDAVLWHCGSWPENGTYYAVHALLGGNQHASPDMMRALKKVVDSLRAARNIPASRVVGHQELSPTACPGTLQQDFVIPYRNGTLKTESEPRVVHFPETGKTLRGGFLSFYEKYGGVKIFGLPLTNEFVEDGLTVQYFERARFEWHPHDGHGKPEDFHVVLGRVGAELLELQDRLKGDDNATRILAEVRRLHREMGQVLGGEA